jgi:C4-dicarboxylate-specific signal transduction histidine kinase
VFLDAIPCKRADDYVGASELMGAEAEAELAHANRVATMGYLAASIVHEVKQPIAAMVTNAQAALRWLDRPTPDVAEVRDALMRIVREGARAGSLVGRTRDLAKKKPRRKDPLEINTTIRDAIELVRAEAAQNRVTVQADMVEGLPMIEGDRVELQQVVLNLIINAIEAMCEIGEGPRELQVTTGKNEAGDVLVSIRDSGPGLAPGVQEDLFNAFHTSKPNGLGLGLSICRSIVEAHGGRLWASANAPRGAVFQFTLPSPRNTTRRAASARKGGAIRFRAEQLPSHSPARRRGEGPMRNRAA